MNQAEAVNALIFPDNPSVSLNLFLFIPDLPMGGESFIFNQTSTFFYQRRNL